VRIVACIPARYESSRFRGKLLEHLGDKSILHHVHDRVLLCEGVHEIFIATGDEEIRVEGERIGASMISSDDPYICGTDRCLGALGDIGPLDILINVQADQPLLHPPHIDQLITFMQAHPAVEIATLRSSDRCFSQSTHVVKMYIDSHGRGVRFSRDLLQDQVGYEHLGIYGFRSSVLASLKTLEPSKSELQHSLEQLRWLDHGYDIYSLPVDFVSRSINTPRDLEAIKKMH